MSKGKPLPLGTLVVSKRIQGQVEEALALFQQSLGINERIGDVKGQAVSQQKVAGIKALQGNVEEAETLYQEALYTFRNISSAAECSNNFMEICRISS